VTPNRDLLLRHSAAEWTADPAVSSEYLAGIPNVYLTGR